MNNLGAIRYKDKIKIKYVIKIKEKYEKGDDEPDVNDDIDIYTWCYYEMMHYGYYEFDPDTGECYNRLDEMFDMALELNAKKKAS